MTPLTRLLRERIDRDGPISVAAFMAAALGHPDWGYYRRRDPLGVQGDFTTAPEISQMFGELIGLWCAETWRMLGSPSPVVVAELGPGRGTLMADFLRAAKMVPAFAEAIELHLVETSPVLKARQRMLLAGARPTWHDHWATLPDKPMLLVANEFLDALPIRQFVRRAGGWRERMVGHDEGHFRFEDGPQVEADFPPAEEGAIFEVNEPAQDLARFVAGRLHAREGAALFVDYGHPASTPGETLQAVRRHAYAAVLEEPGEADLTAHVDFAAICRAAHPAQAYGPVPQGLFLTRLGIRERTEALARTRPDKAMSIVQGCQRLIDATEMGTLFNALAIAPRAGLLLPGFAD